MRHDKLDRELTLLLLLTENRQYDVKQLCERLGVSRRNLYYYLSFFRDFGFTVERHGTTYRIDKNSPFFTKLFRKVHFTEDEAITMRRILENVTGNSIQVEHLKRKLDELYDLNILDDVQLREQQAQLLSVLYDAVKFKRCVVIHGYSSPHSNTVSDRVVEPYLFLNHNNEVRCYEPTSKQNKTFKLQRMQSVELLADEWQHERQHRQLFTDIFMFSGEEQHTVSLRMGRLARNILVEEYPKAAAYVTDDGADHWLLQLEVCSYMGIGRFVLGLYDDIEVLSDDGFRRYLKEKTEKMAAQTQETSAQNKGKEIS